MKCVNRCDAPFERDYQLGHVVCTGCGGVAEENSMVSELGFSENSKGAAIADGFTLKAGQTRAKSKAAFGGSAALRSHQDSSEATRDRGHSAIERAGCMQGINMAQPLIEKAKRIFDIALNQKFTGRKSNCVVAACCYITCRMEGTSHMMIDFADAFSTNLYQIGAIFLKLRALFFADNPDLNYEMPLVDPGLYMARFADKLDFGSDAARVVANANKISKRMDRDWINLGRRPAGICAACLFIAARMSGYQRTIKEIVLVVKICEGTLRLRLKEFEMTDSGKLPQETFENINLDRAANPPSFTTSVKRKVVHNDVDDIDVEELTRETTAYVTKVDGCDDIVPVEETLSDLDDDEEVLNSIAMSDDESKFKESLWMAENGEWHEAQKTKGLLPKKEPAKKRVKKDPNVFRATTALEATRKMLEDKPKLSSKINYDVLNGLFDSF